jgi:predicted O-methyltransferase YrrM
MISKNIYKNFSFNTKYKKKLIEFFKHNTTIENGGYKIFDNTYNDLLQNPDELCELIFFLKKRKNNESYLEIGFGHGLTNTILNKFFSFKKIVAVDPFGAHIRGNTLIPNIRFKNLILICQKTNSQIVKNELKKLAPFDIILIDGDHSYDAVKYDFNVVKNFVKKGSVIVFHDINFEDSGSMKFWKSIKKEYKTKEIIAPSNSYGFGIVTF